MYLKYTHINGEFYFAWLSHSLVAAISPSCGNHLTVLWQRSHLLAAAISPTCGSYLSCRSYLTLLRQLSHPLVAAISPSYDSCPSIFCPCHCPSSRGLPCTSSAWRWGVACCPSDAPRPRCGTQSCRPK